MLVISYPSLEPLRACHCAVLFHPLCNARAALTRLELRAFALPVAPTQCHWFCRAPVVLAGLAVGELGEGTAASTPGRYSTCHDEPQREQLRQITAFLRDHANRVTV